MAFAGMLFALRQARLLEQVAAFVYAGGALGVTFSGDLLTLFVFWELMAVGSTLVIWSADTPAAYRASVRYLMIHLLGGVVLMAGIAGHYVETTPPDVFSMMLMFGVVYGLYEVSILLVVMVLSIYRMKLG